MEAINSRAAAPPHRNTARAKFNVKALAYRDVRWIFLLLGCYYIMDYNILALYGWEFSYFGKIIPSDINNFMARRYKLLSYTDIN